MSTDRGGQTRDRGEQSKRASKGSRPTWIGAGNQGIEADMVVHVNVAIYSSCRLWFVVAVRCGEPLLGLAGGAGRSGVALLTAMADAARRVSADGRVAGGGLVSGGGWRPVVRARHPARCAAASAGEASAVRRQWERWEGTWLRCLRACRGSAAPGMVRCGRDRIPGACGVVWSKCGRVRVRRWRPSAGANAATRGPVQCGHTGTDARRRVAVPAGAVLCDRSAIECECEGGDPRRVRMRPHGDRCEQARIKANKRRWRPTASAKRPHGDRCDQARIEANRRAARRTGREQGNRTVAKRSCPLA